ncbi:UDP-N-acetylmuramoyl-L-alanine--D-glutamate ligase [Actinomycetospora atypica]|uniref:UDP-N-acetylmuramoylalanine--D-glutamate ligase n=1 Tax=Actinomycetospora atypica TaxID=1290095 RepID=A0ABV9YJ95_9PSEU
MGGVNIKIAIVGWCEQGRSACRYWNPDEHEIVVHSLVRPADLPVGVRHIDGPDHVRALRGGGYDKVLRVPIVHPEEFNLSDGRAVASEKVTTATDEFLRAWQRSRVIGVTGTKGKSTTSALIARLIAATGAAVRTGGNNGTSPLDLLTSASAAGEWVVLELANFQLIDLDSRIPNMVLLPVDLDHLDWHRSEQEYLDVKFRPLSAQCADDWAFMHESHRSRSQTRQALSRRVFYPGSDTAHVREGWVFFGEYRVIPVDRLAIPGVHNLINVCAALTTAITLLGWHQEFVDVLESFAGCAHRLEKIPGASDLCWVDDSAATTPAAAAAALRTVSIPMVIILGGSDKALSWSPLLEAMVWARSAGRLRAAITVGAVACGLADAIYDRLPGLPVITVTPPGRMDMAVDAARSLASPGDCVLLSPGFASLDQYESYSHRSEEFRKSAAGAD